MRYIFIILGFLSIIAGCAPVPTETSSYEPDTVLQYKNNVSALYGRGGKIAKESDGRTKASNIIWKDSLGNIQSLDSLRGKKILINFLAIWCQYCQYEMPDLESISENGDAVVIGVSVLDLYSSLFDRSKLYADSTVHIKFQIVVDPLSKTYVNYGGNGTLPWSFIIDRDGYIVQKFIGQGTKQDFMTVLKQIP